jgi:pimeloyl-ACP methyl ester carboxylesterase
MELVGRLVGVGRQPVQVSEAGTGPVVLLLHGSGPGTTGAGAWANTVRALGGFRFVVPDQAGFGDTPLPPGSRGGLDVWVSSAAALMDELGDELGIERYAVVGHSMGGAVALALAAARPDAVTRVVAVASMGAPGAALSPDLDGLWGATAGLDGAREMLTRLYADPTVVTDAMIEARAAAIAAGAANFARMFPPPRQRWADDLALSAATLSAVQAPVLLVHGANDRLTPLDTAAVPLLPHLGDVRLHVFGRCGHVPQVEHATEFQRLLRDFLQS